VAETDRSVSRASPFVRTYFIEAHPVSLTKIFDHCFDPEFAATSLCGHSKNHALIQTKLAELGHPQSR